MRDSNKVVWSSDETQDFWLYTATDDEVISEYASVNFDSVLLKSGEEVNIDDADISNMDIDGMRDYFAYDDLNSESDYETLRFNIIPAVEEQCYHNYLWLIGNYQRWSGGKEALGFFTDAEQGLIDTCYPNYDSTSELLNDDGNLVFTEYTHDAPMGGTHMTLYSFKDKASFDAAEDYINTEYTETDYEGNQRHIPEYWGYEASIDDLAEDFDAVSAWIDNGWLTPVSAKLW